MPEVLVADTETDGLLDGVTKLHMVQIGSLNGKDVVIYCDNYDTHEELRARSGVMVGDTTLYLTCPIRPLAEGLERLRAASEVWFHNGIGYDLHILDRFAPGVMDRKRLRDSLVAARLLCREFDNSLEAWGRRLKCHKGDFKGPWDVVTAEMLAYSQQDIPAGRALVRHLLSRSEGAERALELEHAVAYWIDRQMHTGFHLDENACGAAYADLLAEKRELEVKVRETFKPRWVSKGSYVPSVNSTKFGYTKGVPLTRVEYEVFEPGSRHHIASRLMAKGWKPTELTPTGQPVIDDEVLERLSTRFPEAKLLASYFTAEKFSGLVAGWLKHCVKGKVHGRVNTIGAWTQRMTHSKPNVAQTPKAGAWRALWLPRPGWVLVGCDGEGIQLRVLAHYLAPSDGGVFAERLHSGKSDDRTDQHSANAIAIGDLFPQEMEFKPRRDTVKNIAYAILFGAQDARLGQTLKDGILGYAKLKPPRTPSKELGGAIRRSLEKSMKGLSALNILVEKTFEVRKFLRGLDGRKLFPPSKRNALVALIQSGEAIIMKLALVIFADEVAVSEGWEYDQDWALVANIHDEFQIECRPEIAESVKAKAEWCISEAGRRLNLKCQFAGKASIGKNWAETH